AADDFSWERLASSRAKLLPPRQNSVNPKTPAALSTFFREQVQFPVEAVRDLLPQLFDVATAACRLCHAVRSRSFSTMSARFIVRKLSYRCHRRSIFFFADRQQSLLPMNPSKVEIICWSRSLATPVCTRERKRCRKLLQSYFLIAAMSNLTTLRHRHK